MFIEINDISTGVLVTEPLNVYSIDYVYKKTVNSKYRVIFKLNNGLVKEEEYDTEADANNRISEIKEISPGGGGGGSYVLPIASATRLGGVKVGENLSIDNNGVLSATGGSGSEVLTLDMSEVATTEVMYALINGQSPININVTEQSHPIAFQELTDVFEDSRFGSANLNVLISNDLLNNIIIPAESNLGSQFVTPAISAITTFGISTYLSIQINQSSNNLYIVGLAVDAFADKQDALVSGTNIKTINNESILGSGNLDIGGSSVIDIDISPIWNDLYTNKSVSLTAEDTTGIYNAVATLFTTDISNKMVNLYVKATDVQVESTDFYTLNIPISVMDFGNDDETKPGVERGAQRALIGIFSYKEHQNTYINYINIESTLTSGIAQSVDITLVREPNPIGFAPPAPGLTYKGNLPSNNGYGGTNLSAIDTGIYYGGAITQFSLVNNPSANQRLDIGNYGVYIRRGYLFILNKAVADAETNEVFAIMYGTGRESSDIITGIVTFTKKENTAGFSVSQNTQSVTNVVDLTTNQTISSKKTFNTIPVCGVTPNADNHLVNKKYVDDTVAAQLGTVSNQLSQI